MKKNTIPAVLTILGLTLLGIGLVLLKAGIAPQGIMRAFPYVCIGIGCGMFGYGMGDIIKKKTIKHYPDIAKQIEIEQNDERNITIGNKAKAKAYDMMVFIYGALMFAFALIGVDLTALLLLAASYLFVVGYGIYYRCKFDKEM